MQINKKYQSEMDLRAVFFYIIYHWRSILLAALVFAFLVCGYTIIQKKPATSVNSEAVEEAAADLALAEKHLENQRLYKKESIYINLDPQLIWQAKCIYVAKADKTAEKNGIFGMTTDPVDGILEFYSYPLAEVNKEELLEAFGTEKEGFVSELVDIKIDSELNSIQAIVIGSSEDKVKRELTIVESKIEQMNKKAAIIIPHSLIFAGENIVCTADPDLAERQKNFLAAIQQSEKNMNEARSKLNKIQEDGSEHTSLKSYIQTTIIGAVMGIIISACLYAFMFLLRGKLTHADTFSDHYNLPVFGEFRKSGSLHKEKGLDKLIAKWELGKNNASDENVYNNISVLINEQKEKSRILLLSTLNEEKLNPIKDALKMRLSDKEIEAEGNFLQSSDAVLAVSRVDAVILVEEKNVSYNASIQRMAETLVISKADVIGVIVL